MTNSELNAYKELLDAYMEEYETEVKFTDRLDINYMGFVEINKGEPELIISGYNGSGYGQTSLADLKQKEWLKMIEQDIRDMDECGDDISRDESDMKWDYYSQVVNIF